ncbi:unnamed protein product [Owenia fusiformis]|uniref:Uncharacterized protein n=1 Tax=Owenia fusiformis TaxID=6347 RepID=A0A8J1T5M4_OWEFU|nr:unnamed protein product [Owenia fusiformis]
MAATMLQQYGGNIVYLPVTSPPIIPQITPQITKEMKVNWATSPGNAPKQDTSKHFHIFVGDLSPDIETHLLREAFTPYGVISDCKIIRDPQTLKSKGYGFVSFVKKEEAENAIQGMSGAWIGTRPIRTNWATRKPPAPTTKENTIKALDYQEVYEQTSESNHTVYVGGLGAGLSEELIQKTFGVYGNIQEIRVFKDKGYAFVRFSNKESACNAIVTVHGTEIKGQAVKCSWGKESNESNAPGGGENQFQQAQGQASYSSGPGFGNYQMSGQMGYPSWYQQQGGYQQGGYGTQMGAAQMGAAAGQYGQYGYPYNMAGMQGAGPNYGGQMAMQQQQAPQQYNGQQQQQGMMGYPVQQGLYSVLIPI